MIPVDCAALSRGILSISLVGGEGPIGFILAPSRELARQTFDVIKGFCVRLGDSGRYPRLRMQLLC
jgi:ATP-dependent RNA helicase DDX41